MPRSPLVRSLGFTLLGLVALSIGNRPPIHASQAPAVIAAATVGGGFGGAQDEPLERGPVVHLAARPMSFEATRTWSKLQEKVSMNFPNDTPLEDILKYVRECTKDKDAFPEGIPIYVDPAGLQDADKTINSSATIDLKGIPLATTLRLILKQLGLAYRIEKEGFLLITSESADDSPADPEALILDNLSALRMEVKALREEVRLLHGQGRSIMGGSVGGPGNIPPESKPAGGMGSKGGMM